MRRYRDRFRELAPHYVVIVLLIVVVLSLADVVVGDLSRPARLVLAAATAVAYPLLLRQLGRAPPAWS